MPLYCGGQGRVGSRNITKRGVTVLGEYLDRQLKQADLKQVDLLDRLKAIGFDTDPNTISKLINGDVRFLRSDLMSALAALKLFTDTKGRPLTTDELIMIACEMIPAPGWAVPDPAKTAYPEAVRFLLEAKGNQSIEEFAKRLNLKPQELEAILQGQRPLLGQIFAMGVLFADGNPMPLARAWGMAEDAPLPNGAKNSNGSLV